MNKNSPMVPANVEVIAAETVAVTLAVLNGAGTVREVARQCGRSISATHKHLQRARALGLVLWEDEKRGTLRPGIGPVPGGVEHDDR